PGRGRRRGHTPGRYTQPPLRALLARAVPSPVMQGSRGMGARSYKASRIKRIRATKAEVEVRREALLNVIADGRPMTVRQVFYQATVHGLVEKAETGYSKVQTDLTVMRRAGD